MSAAPTTTGPRTSRGNRTRTCHAGYFFKLAGTSYRLANSTPGRNPTCRHSNCNCPTNSAEYPA